MLSKYKIKLLKDQVVESYKTFVIQKIMGVGYFCSPLNWNRVKHQNQKGWKEKIKQVFTTVLLLSETALQRCS